MVPAAAGVLTRLPLSFPSLRASLFRILNFTQELSLATLEWDRRGRRLHSEIRNPLQPLPPVYGHDR